MRAFENQRGMTLGTTVRVQTVPSASVSDGAALRARTVLPWCALVVAAVLSLALGAGLYEGLGGGRSSVAPAAAHSHALSQKGLLSLPLAAQGSVSASLGADIPAYRVGASAGGFRATSPAQHLSSSFTASGVSLSAGATRLRLSLRGVGYGASLRGLAGVAPRADGNRVVYARPGLNESYTNGPLGLEQGFTIAKAPAGHAAGPLTLSMALSGNAQASLLKGGQSITLSRSGKAVLRYTGLRATDARGRALRSWLQLDGGRLLLRVDADGARYPVRIDPFVENGSEHTPTPSEETSESYFGVSVALSGDGETALIGAPLNEQDPGNTVRGKGAAWVFVHNSVTSEWEQQGPKLEGSGEEGYGNFGQGVALSGDGNTALVGGYYDHGGTGAVWVFTREDGTWTAQPSKLTGTCVSCVGYFGYSVALSEDGRTAVIGSVSSHVWEFTSSGFKQPFAQQGAPLAAGKYAGVTVALSGDGKSALIGGEESAWAVAPDNGTWTNLEELKGNGQTKEDPNGVGVALSQHGNTALVGEGGDEAVWVYTRPGAGSPYGPSGAQSSNPHPRNGRTTLAREWRSRPPATSR